MDALALLTADHNRVRGLFARFQEAEEASDTERMEARKASLGAPTAADKEHLSVEELQRLATEQQIPGRSTMNREELLATVAPE